jgi:hypothetical protein
LAYLATPASTEKKSECFRNRNNRV